MLLRLGNFAKLKKLARSQVFFISKMTFDKHLVLLSSTSTLVQKASEARLVRQPHCFLLALFSAGAKRPWARRQVCGRPAGKNLKAGVTYHQ